MQHIKLYLVDISYFCIYEWESYISTFSLVNVYTGIDPDLGRVATTPQMTQLISLLLEFIWMLYILLKSH